MQRVRDRWISENYTEIKGWLKKITRNQNQDVVDDFVHDVMMIFLNHEKADELILRNEARWFIVRIGLNQWRSTTSHHHKTYRPPFLELLESFNNNPQLEEKDENKEIVEGNLLNALQEMYEGTNREKYLALIIIFYISVGNFSELGRRINLPRTTVTQNFHDGVKILLEKYEKIKKINNYYEKNEEVVKLINLNYFKNYGEKKDI